MLQAAPTGLRNKDKQISSLNLGQNSVVEVESNRNSSGGGGGRRAEADNNNTWIDIGGGGGTD